MKKYEKQKQKNGKNIFDIFVSILSVREIRQTFFEKITQDLIYYPFHLRKRATDRLKIL